MKIWLNHRLVEELNRTISHLKNERAGGSMGILPEMVKYAGGKF